jgi:uncharacterized protein YkwD
MSSRSVLAHAATVLALVLGPLGLVVATSGSASAAPSATQLDALRSMDPEVYEKKVQRIINRKRDARGLRPLKVHACTDAVAERWGKHLAENLAFYHQSLDPLFDRCGATYAGETLARGAVTPAQMVRMWMQSDGHRRILLSRYPTRIGLGAYLDSRGDWLVAADFTRL